MPKLTGSKKAAFRFPQESPNDVIPVLEAEITTLRTKLAEAVKALEPFALMSTEGVVKQITNYSTVTTLSDYFHAAARVVAAYRKEGSNNG